MSKKILVFGAGYVGCSLGILFARKNKVVLIDTDSKKVSEINKGSFPINEPLTEKYKIESGFDLFASENFAEYIHGADFIILALPTDYQEKTHSFNTSTIETVLSKISKLKINFPVIIKSTVYIGFTEALKKSYPNLNIIYVPEFLREGNAIHDNIYPSRIVIGDDRENANQIADLFQSIARNCPEVHYMSSSEAEAVKLFSNAYLATRVSFFNELDSFALAKNLNSKNIIKGISSDPRIGDYYHNPSFGYGGYCLPKDTKQLVANFETIPQEIFQAVIRSNDLRKQFIAQTILSYNVKIIGIYYLSMKKGSNNFRESAILDIIEILERNQKKILVFEPLLSSNHDQFSVLDDLDEFKRKSDLIIANRIDEPLLDVKDKVFTRDIFNEN